MKLWNENGKTIEILRFWSHVVPLNHESIHSSMGQWTFAKSDLPAHNVHKCFENNRSPFCSHSNCCFAHVYASRRDHILPGKQSPGGWVTFASPLAPERPIEQSLFVEWQLQPNWPAKHFYLLHSASVAMPVSCHPSQRRKGPKRNMFKFARSS